MAKEAANIAQGLKHNVYFVAVAAPFDFAQGRLKRRALLQNLLIKEFFRNLFSPCRSVPALLHLIAEFFNKFQSPASWRDHPEEKPTLRINCSP
jgi:hypothetical protein